MKTFGKVIAEARKAAGPRQDSIASARCEKTKGMPGIVADENSSMK